MSLLMRSSRLSLTSSVGRISSRSFSGKVTILESGQELSKIMKEGNKILYFTATWCPPCRAIKPVFEKLSNEFAKTQFIKIDIDENEKTAYEYQITSVPTFIFLKGSSAVAQFSGANETALRTHLTNLEK